MGAPLGNKNAAKAKLWSAAIDRALSKRCGGDKVAALNELAEKLLAACDQGEQWALKELGDRLDGKPAQSVTVGGDDDAPLKVDATVRLVKPGV